MSSTEKRIVPALFDGNRLRQARIYRGLKKVDVAGVVDLTPAAIGQFESGKARPSSSAYASLALHLGFPPEFFERRGQSAHVTESHAHFRKLRSTSKMARDQSLVRLELLAELLMTIEGHVELPASDVPTYPIADDAPDPEPERAAAAVRESWGLGKGPIDSVVRLLEGRGVVIVRPQFDASGVDAYSTWIGDRAVVVLSSEKADAARSRFDAAHELGHLVMHHDAEPGRHVVENQANRFAAAFLMPADVIGKEFPSRMSWPVFFRLKERWRVSLQALLYRARTLGALGPESYRRAQIYLSRQGWRDNEPIEIGAPEEPTLWLQAFALMQAELDIDEKSVAVSCCLPDEVFSSLLS